MATKDEGIFRKVSLDRLSSPDELDTVMQVMGSRSWLGIGAIAFLLLVVLIWSIVGSVPTQVQAQALLIHTGGVFDVHAPSTGRISELRVVEGQVLGAGEPILRIEQPNLATQLVIEEERLSELNKRHNEIMGFGERDLRSQENSLDARRDALKLSIQNNEERRKTLEAQEANEQELVDDKLLTVKTVLQTQTAKFATMDRIAQAENEILQLEIERESLRGQKKEDNRQRELEIEELMGRIKLLKTQIGQSTEVGTLATELSARDESVDERVKVIEIKVRAGDQVNLGMPLVSLQRLDQDPADLKAMIYVLSKDGKDIAPDDDVQISPLSYPREEFGFLKGKVNWVSPFPSTFQGMMKVLANDVLVRSMMVEGAPFAVEARLEGRRDPAPGPDDPCHEEKDPERACFVSPYEWSTKKGKKLAVDSGTLCVVTITVETRPPIELVIPYVREKLGI